MLSEAIDSRGEWKILSLPNIRQLVIPSRPRRNIVART